MKTPITRSAAPRSGLRAFVMTAVVVGLAASGAITSPAVAAPPADPAAASTIPEADVISVDFAEDGPLEHARERELTVGGTAPEVVYDESLQRHVAEFAAADDKPSTGTGAYTAEIPDAWSTDDPAHEGEVDLLDGGTFECYFRYDGESPVPSGQASQLCGGGPEGYAFYLPATGEGLRFKATSGSAHKNTATAPVTLRPGEWVHAVATVGDGDIRMYLNGAPAWNLQQEEGNALGSGRNHKGPYTELKVDSVPKWGIGGAPTADGFAQPTAGAVAASRAWSTVLTDAEVADLWRQEKPTPPEVELPEADILDVDFSDEADPFRDHSPSDRAPKVTGTSDVRVDPAFAEQPHRAYTSDGKRDHAFYPLQDAWADTGEKHSDDIETYKDDTWAGDGVTMQCDIKVNEELPVEGTPHVCAGKSGGGFGIHLKGSSIVAGFHVNGGYKSVTSPEIRSGVWHSVVATFDGTKVDLYLDGERVGSNTTNTVGAVKAPTSGSVIEPYVRYYAIGSDIAGRGSIETPAAATVGNARIWSTALTGDQAAQLDRESFGDRSAAPELASSVPAAGSVVNGPTEFDVTIDRPELATGWTYTLDGEPIATGDTIGAGMAAGDHEIVVSATDVFGRPVNWTIPFTSPRIPIAGGTDTQQKNGSARLTAIATSESEKVTTTFTEAALTDASGGVQGTIDDSPENLGLDFANDVDDATAITRSLALADDGAATSPAAHDGFPFQRFDVDLPNADAGQQLLWSGTADPARVVKLWVWNNDKGVWSLAGKAAGKAEGETELRTELHSRLIDQTDPERPQVHVAVTAEDPFSDDLAPRDESAGTPEEKDHFEDPDDYDFSFVHYTDQQYTTEVATGSSGDWPASLPWQHIDGATNTPEEASVFEQALRQQNEWIADNADERKIDYVANTGDLINSDVSLNDLQFDPDAPDPGDGSSVFDYTTSDGSVPGSKEQIRKEFTTVRDLQEPLRGSGVPNQTVAGNHDNHNGTHNGPTSPFSAFFTAEGYYDQAENAWPADASYHAMDEVTDPDTGEVVTPGEDNSNSYVLFSAGGLDFVAVGLSYGVTQEESDWADAVFKRFPDRNGILMTHGYLGTSKKPDGRDAALGADGSKLYDEIVRDNRNVFLVLGGHFHGVGTNIETIAGKGHKVVQMLADYQGYMVPASTIFTKERCAAAGLDPETQCVFGAGEHEGKIDVDGDGSWDHFASDKLAMGASFLRMLQFDTKQNTMSVDSYSPFLDEFGTAEYDHGSSPKDTPEPIERYNGAEDNLTVPIDLTTRTTSFATAGLTVASPTDEVIGKRTVRSGMPAVVRWEGLTEGETYAWMARSTEGVADDARAAAESGAVTQFGDVFVATAAGTDTEPPVLTIPGPTRVDQGAEFDPLAGVTAVDDTDGDVSDRIEVIGEVDTSTPGPYVLTYSVDDTNGNQALGSRFVSVRAASGDGDDGGSGGDGGDDGDDGSGGGDGSAGDGGSDGSDGSGGSGGSDGDGGSGGSGGTDGAGDDGVSGDPAGNGDPGEAGDDGGFLPATGAQISVTVIAAALVLLGVGGVLALITRRRRASGP